MLMDLISSLREWGPWALGAAFVGGVLIGNLVRSLKVRLWLSFALIFVPPLVIAALYWWASSSACSGVDCSATVYAFLGSVAFAIFPIFMGIGTLLGSMIAGVRRSIDRWVTPQTPHASGAG